MHSGEVWSGCHRTAVPAAVWTTKPQVDLQARLEELSGTCDKLRDTAQRLASSQQAAAAAEKEAEQVGRRGEDLRRALGAAEEGSRKLEGELAAERKACADARSEAQDAHEEAAQRKQVIGFFRQKAKQPRQPCDAIDGFKMAVTSCICMLISYHLSDMPTWLQLREPVPRYAVAAEQWRRVS